MLITTYECASDFSWREPWATSDARQVCYVGYDTRLMRLLSRLVKFCLPESQDRELLQLCNLWGIVHLVDGRLSSAFFTRMRIYAMSRRLCFCGMRFYAKKIFCWVSAICHNLYMCMEMPDFSSLKVTLTLHIPSNPIPVYDVKRTSNSTKTLYHTSIRVEPSQMCSKRRKKKSCPQRHCHSFRTPKHCLGMLHSEPCTMF